MSPVAPRHQHWIDRAVALAVEKAAGAPILVVGDGPDAEAIRASVAAAGPPASSTPPGVAIVTEAGRLDDGLRSVADLGTIICCPAVGGEPDPIVDPYRDLHVRGLTVVGVTDDPEDPMPHGRKG